ncbi:hypothetical protein [Limosilactobacillus antri]|nr:hypothetical protein [Limosilactobacillus antri]
MDSVNWDAIQHQQDDNNPDCPWLDDGPSWYDKRRKKEEYQADMEEE